MEVIYGPVPSWRLGRSLGIDPVCIRGKICSFDCLYCQLGRTIHKTYERKIFISEEELEESLSKIKDWKEIDTVTFSGSSEPTLAKNLGNLIKIAKTSGKLIAILTNSSTIFRGDVREDLKKIDIVCAKLDAPNQNLLEKINRPVKGVTFENIFDGIKKFRKEFKGKLALQMMFIDKNKDYAEKMAELAREINPDEVQINTPLRPSPVKPLTKEEILGIKSKFKGLNAITVYESKKPEVKVLDMHETLTRRPVL